ncbi:MAG: alpha/beta hydrolase [Gammaproteobacteria bacterium]
MTTTPGFIFVHGAWHNHNTWDEVISRLNEKGLMTQAFDLPGAGVNARMPASYFKRPLDQEAFATEPSPNAGVTQAERTEFVIDAVREMAARSESGKAILVGHSLGGATVSPVAESVPELLAAVVYVAAFMLPPGMPPIAMIKDPLMADALVPTLFAADPQAIGAMRIDFASPDPEYRERIRQAYCGDLDDTMFERAISHLHCDEPAQVTLEPSPVTRERFGVIPRHYIYCTRDRAVTPAGQQKMISLMDEAMGNRTVVHTLESSHSPFDSRPDELADILAEIAQQDALDE